MGMVHFSGEPGTSASAQETPASWEDIADGDDEGELEAAGTRADLR